MGSLKPPCRLKAPPVFWLLFRLSLVWFGFMSFMPHNISWTSTSLEPKLNPEHCIEVADFMAHIQDYSRLHLQVIRISVYDMHILRLDI